MMGPLEQLLISSIRTIINHLTYIPFTIAVIVEFENFRGPVFNENQPLCVPVCPITVMSQTEIGFHGNSYRLGLLGPRLHTSKSIDRY